MGTSAPLGSQRHLFELPDHVSYLDSAAWSPVPRAVREAGEAGLRIKSEPWSHPRELTEAWAKRARIAAAMLLGCGAGDIAIVGSVSHAIATAARNLPLPAGGRILRVADEFPSQCFVWDQLAAECGLSVEIVARPADHDWTGALLEAIDRPGAAPLAVAALTPLHWSDGTLIDLDRIAPAVRRAGAALVVDATQAVGVMSIDVTRLQPDFLAFPTYKWVLGPYSLAFLYAAPHRQQGQPLEPNSGNRSPAVGAARYDKGERNDPVGLPMAAVGMETVLGWGVPAVAARLRELTDRLADGLLAMGLDVAPRAARAPHILAARGPAALPPDAIARLKAAHVFASDRLGGLRLSPHVYADERDVERCLAAVRELWSGDSRAAAE